MSHRASDVSGVQCKGKGLRHGISRVDNSRKMLHDDLACLSPFLNGEPLHVNVTEASAEAFQMLGFILLAGTAMYFIAARRDASAPAQA